jgi:dTDP-4-dehydrorhamnose 3,5-epimerase
MDSIPTTLSDIILIDLKVFSDDRGFFMETYQTDKYRKLGINCTFVQDNHSGSKQGILRGLHYQIQQPQGKLIRVLSGTIYDVAVDIRRSSPTFKQWIGIEMSAENRHQLWIPTGYAHGFYVMSDWAEVEYKTTDFYAPQYERTILWNDPDLAIDWPLYHNAAPTLSEKDARGAVLREAELFD